MAILALDHVNLRVHDLEATARFFVDVLGMTRSEERASWILDEGGRPVIHLGSAETPYPSDAWRPFVARQDGGAVHHVALSCTGYDAMVARIEAHGVHYDVNEIEGILRQLFVAEPGGVLLELNFRL